MDCQNGSVNTTVERRNKTRINLAENQIETASWDEKTCLRIAFLTGDDFLRTIIVLSPVFHVVNIFFLSSDCHRAHT